MVVTVQHVFIVPYVLPLRLNAAKKREGYWCILQDTKGFLGIGDIAFWPGFGSEQNTVEKNILEQLLIGKTFHTPQETLFLELPVEIRAGVELALLDLLGQENHLPIAQLLVSTPLQQIEASALVETVEQARYAVEQGVLSIKVKVSKDFHLDPLINPMLSPELARLAAIRETIGNDIHLRVDANGAWSEEQALESIKILRRFGLEFIEQPVAKDNIAGLKAVRDQGFIKVAADESMAYLDTLITQDAVDVAVLKPMFLGGLQSTLEIAHRACAHGLQIVVTHALESSIGRWGAVHLACALAGTSIDFLKACGLSGALVNDLDRGPQISFGWVDLPKDFGLGLTDTSRNAFRDLTST